MNGAPMTPGERGILTVTCFGHFICHFNMLVFPALVLPLAGATGLDIADVLGLSFWMYLLFGLTALVWGYLADRLGPRPFLNLMFLGGGLSALGAGLTVDQPGWFSLCLAGIGFFSGIYHPAGLGLISKGIGRVSLAMGYNGMAGNVGLAAAPLFAGLVNWLWGANGAYLLLGVINLSGLWFMARLDLEPAHAAAAGTGEEPARSWKPFLWLLAAMTLGGVAYRGSSVIMPTLLELKSPGIMQLIASVWPGTLSENLVATVLTSLIYAFGILGQYTGGRAGERFDPGRAYLAFHLAALPAAFLMGLASDWSLSLLGMTYLFFLLGMQPVENTLLTRLSPPAWRHSAFGMKFILAFGVGSLAVKGVGWVQETQGLEAVFPALGVVSLGIVACILGLMRLIRTGGRESLASAGPVPVPEKSAPAAN